MAYNLQSYKIETFTGINDQPVAPTTTKAGNGAHLIKQHNELVDLLEGYLGNLEESISQSSVSNWVVVTNDYTANPGESIVFNTYIPEEGKTEFALTLPNNPPIGTPVSFINTNQDIKIIINGFNSFKGQSDIGLSIKDAYILRTLVYIGDQWIPVTTDNYIKYYGD